MLVLIGIFINNNSSQMKKTAVVLFVLIFSSVAMAQDKNNNKRETKEGLNGVRNVQPINPNAIKPAENASEEKKVRPAEGQNLKSVKKVQKIQTKEYTPEKTNATPKQPAVEPKSNSGKKKKSDM